MRKLLSSRQEKESEEKIKIGTLCWRIVRGHWLAVICLSDVTIFKIPTAAEKECWNFSDSLREQYFDVFRRTFDTSLHSRRFDPSSATRTGHSCHFQGHILRFSFFILHSSLFDFIRISNLCIYLPFFNYIFILRCHHVSTLKGFASDFHYFLIKIPTPNSMQCTPMRRDGPPTSASNIGCAQKALSSA